MDLLRRTPIDFVRMPLCFRAILFFLVLQSSLVTASKAKKKESTKGRDLIQLSTQAREPRFRLGKSRALGRVDFAKMKSPFRPQERFVYRVSHESSVHRVLIGTTTMETGRAVLGVGGWALQFRLTARSAEWYRWALQVQSTVDGYLDLTSGDSLYVSMNKKENSFYEKLSIEFDHSSKKIYQKEYQKDGSVRYVQYQMPVKLHDGYVLAYYLRNQDLTRKRTIKCSVYQGGKIYSGAAIVQGQFNITLGGKAYRATKVLLSTRITGALAPKESIVIYYSADSRKVPVLINAAVIAGKFSAELVSGY